MQNIDNFKAIVVGIIYDPSKKKILIGRRENDPYVKELGWCFPGGRLKNNDEIDKALKRHIKAKTGYNVANLGTVFSKIENETGNFLITYFLTEAYKGEEKPGENIIELKWVAPEEIKSYFKTSFNSRLKEYLINLK